MPKIATNNTSFGEYGSEDQIKFKYDVYVSTDGTFSTKLPAEIVERLESCGIPVKTNRLGNKGYVEATSMEELVKAVNSYDAEYLSKEEVGRETVIQYKLTTNANYWKDSKGDIHPNGAFHHTNESSYKSPDNPNDGRGWKFGTNGRNGSGFGVNLDVRIVCKIHSLFKSGRKEVKVISGTFDKEKEPSLFWLNGLNELSSDSFKYSVSEIPATEENAEFFVSMVMALISMNEKIAQFTTPEAILALVENKQKLLS